MIDSALSNVDVATHSIIQPKYDGWWCGVHIIDNRCYYITSGGDVRRWFDLPAVEFEGIELVMIGEYMYGTQWAQSHNVGGMVLHDIAYMEREGVRKHDFSNSPYSHRLEMLQFFFQSCNLERFNIKLIESYSAELYAQQELWQKYVLDMGFEGLVFKSPTHTFGNSFIRVKRFYTRDFVCIDVVEGGGRLKGSMGAIVGALYDNGKFVSKVSVGGGFTDVQRREIWDNKDHYIGKVFEVKAWAVFESGSMRHPNFLRWRNDKQPIDCKP